VTQHRDAFLLSGVLSLIVLLGGFVGRETDHSQRDDVARHIAMLHSHEAGQKAAAAFWLGRHGVAAQPAIPALVELLGDATKIDSAQYHKAAAPQHEDLLASTVGQEAAAALVNIGNSATDALIRTLITSPEPHARENAAWALGALHRRQMI
jgi:HEAT repeat protein